MLEMDGCHILIWWQGYSTDRFPRWPPIFTGDLVPFSHCDILHSGNDCVGQKLPRSVSNRFLPIAQAILVSEQAKLCDT